MSNVLANSGFGLLTARKFAEAGHAVHDGFRSKERAGDLDALALELPNIHPVRLDVIDQASIDDAIAQARKAGPIDVLASNAGFELTRPVDGADPQEVADLVFEAATTSTPQFRYVAGADARAFIPAFRNQDFESFRGAMLSRLGFADWEARA
jgi:NAD(P)-dependent dehydrogenase (short-subunit alcohol dehydrogenase family)